MSLTVVILAAGRGTRMRTDLPKVLHPLAGKPMLERVYNTAKRLSPARIFVVYGNAGSWVRDAMDHLDVTWIQQKQQLGTGHAIMQVLPHLNPDEQVLILYGDVPLISQETLDTLISTTPRQALGLVVTDINRPKGFGRIIRNELGNIVEIVEENDATGAQRKITEINTGILTASAKHLQDWVPNLKSDNSQKEYYLTDIVKLAVSDGFSVGGIVADCVEEVLGVNSLAELAKQERFYQLRKARQLMDQGVTLMDPHRFDCRGRIQVDNDVVIDINVVFEGDINIGSNTVIGPNTTLKNVTIGKNVVIRANCVIEEAVIEDNSIVGPFARLRPGALIKSGAKVGNFVEIKKSVLGEGSKASHLSYLGDAVIGKDVNIGAGTITCNYDGVNKHQTIIQDNAFIGSDSQLIAPVTVGKNATIGAGSTITQDAPANTLTIARARQTSIKGWQPGTAVPEEVKD